MVSRAEHRIAFWHPEESKPTRYSIEEFEEWSGMRYLPELEFKDSKTKQHLLRRVEEEMRRPGRAQNAKWYGSLYAKEFQAHQIADLAIRKIDDKVGHGLIALQDLDEGTYIGEYTGLVRPINFLWPEINEYCFRYPVYGFHWHIYTIDAKMQANETSFINHSDQPNCSSFVMLQEGLFHVGIRANQKISAGEELRFDYGKYLSRKFQ